MTTTMVSRSKPGSRPGLPAKMKKLKIVSTKESQCITEVFRKPSDEYKNCMNS